MDDWIHDKKPIRVRRVDWLRAPQKEAAAEERLNRLASATRPGWEGLADRGAPDSGGSDGLSLGEQALVSNYRGLASVPHLATRCFVTTGDLRLVRALYNHFFLGVGRR